MHKELIISTTSKETKLAILENDELVEYYIERDLSQGIVGNIYKGRVTKVLPGMQSAFVDIGLERDAFLYVSDFLEDTEEYDKIVSTVEDEVASLQPESPSRPAPPPVPAPSAPIPSTAAFLEPQAEPLAPLSPEGEPVAESLSEPAAETFDRKGGRRRDRDRDRDRDRRGGKKPKIPSFESKTYESRPDDRPYAPLEVMPGESLRKYGNRPLAPQPEQPAPEPPVTDKEAGHEGAVAEEPPPPPTLTEASADDAPPQEKEPAENVPDVRLSDQSDNFKMTHRPQRRPRRRGGNGGNGGGPPRTEDSRSANGHSHRVAPLIAELLREGQEILVQVSKEPLGKKGARITSHIALPGRYLVYMPTVDHIGVSRKIASDEERSRLKRIIHENRAGLPGGFIVRTAAEGRGEGEFIQDIRFLGNLWADIRAKAEKKAAPAMIHRDLNLVQRTLRDQLTEEFTAIRIDNETEFATVLDFVNKFQPKLVNRVKLHLRDTPIFEEYGLNTEIDKALKSKVWLKSGGYIVINQTEALVAIDVNTGKYVGRSNRLEDTIARTNLDAVHEIVRQIRLRNLGGIIVVDFIDMEEKKNRQKVMAALEEEIRSDRVPSKILQFNDFGLVAITRKRTQPSLERTICVPCEHCHGSGWMKSPETVCYEIQQEIRKMANMLETKEITVRVHPDVAKVLKGGEFVSLVEMEEWTRKDIIVKSDPLLHEEHFDIF